MGTQRPLHYQVTQPLSTSISRRTVMTSSGLLTPTGHGKHPMPVVPPSATTGGKHFRYTRIFASPCIPHLVLCSRPCCTIQKLSYRSLYNTFCRNFSVKNPNSIVILPTGVFQVLLNTYRAILNEGFFPYHHGNGLSTH